MLSQKEFESFCLQTIADGSTENWYGHYKLYNAERLALVPKDLIADALIELSALLEDMIAYISENNLGEMKDLKWIIHTPETWKRTRKMYSDPLEQPAFSIGFKFCIKSLT